MPTTLGIVASHRTATAPAGLPTTGLVLHLDADDASAFTFRTGTVISEWRDKSGGGHHATSLNPTNNTRPTLDAAINGRPAVKIEPGTAGQEWTHPWLIIPAFASSYTAGELFMVLQIVTDNSGAYHYKWGTEPSLWSHYTAGDVIYDSWGTTSRKAVGNPTPALTQPHIYNLITQPGAYSGLVNNVLLSTNADNTVTFGAADPYQIPMSGNPPIGSIGEYVMYNRALATNERNQAYSYLAGKWGIA